MSYIVFARKYRPQTFDDIVGQSHITTTLKNAILQDRVAHAYIFAGPRGVGKTTTARIFAKALNCEKGPTATPCNSCSSCKEITQGASLDILEIDGASNRGIDEIRNLRENVKFAPTKGQFKVYIIDEVHMLTAEAFNAILKTLEEPPSHTKFIFATTQPYKIPATILSRCQRFDFRRIATHDIFENLKRIIKEEKLNVKAEALGLIAKHSDGSMRDGQVILDQIVSSAEGHVGPEDVTRILGIVDDEILFGLSGAISEKDSVGALKIIDCLVKDGKDILQTVFGLIEHFRNLSVVKIDAKLNSLIDAGLEEIKHYEAESKRFTMEEILYIIYTLANTIDFIRKSNLPRIPLEAAMVKLTLKGPILSLAEVMARIDRLGSPDKATAQDVVKEIKVPVRSEDSADLNEILSYWGGVVNYLKTKKMSVASYLQEGYPVNVDSKTITIGFPKEAQFHKEVLESPENRHLIEEAVSQTLKRELKVTLILVEPLAAGRRPTVEYTAKDDAEETAGKIETKEPKDETDPIVKAALEMFGGEIAPRRAERERPR